MPLQRDENKDKEDEKKKFTQKEPEKKTFTKEKPGKKTFTKEEVDYINSVLEGVESGGVKCQIRMVWKQIGPLVWEDPSSLNSNGL